MLKFFMVMILMMIMKTDKVKITLAFMTLLFNMSLQTWSMSKMSMIFLGDQMSFWNANLAMWVALILAFTNVKSSKFHKLMMLAALFLFSMIFYSWNMLTFYMLFEMSMILMLMIMVTWSYQPERVEAIMFLIVMALMFSLPFMSMMMKNFEMLNFWFMSMNVTLLEYLSILFIFMMKMPFYFMHFWLPKVHVEAPVQGSMILAAIMLKLGCYGMLRFTSIMAKFKILNLIFMSIGMWSMVVLSMSCFIQSDIKTLIAYSSIVHMGIVLLTILINKKKSVTASITIMVSHGMCASALFFMANVFYSNSKSRSILLNKSYTQMFPMLKALWFMVCMSNTPMPPAISMIGEILSLKLILSFTNMYTLIFMMTLTSSLYSIFMFYKMIQGTFSKLLKMKMTTEIKTILIITLHLNPLILMSMKPKMLMIM